MPINIKIGWDCRIVNLDTKEDAHFQIHEVNQYKDQIMVYASKKPHSVRVNRGIVVAPERPAAWVILPHAHPQEVAAFTKAVGGLRLAIRQGKDLLYIVNLPRTRLLRDAPNVPKEELLKACQQAIDAYLDWKRLGSLPVWWGLVRGS